MNSRMRALFALLSSVLLLLAASWAVAGDYGPLAPQKAVGPRAPGAAGSMRSAIEMIDPSGLSCDGVITFDDVLGGTDPGTNYDAIFESDGADFGEKFVCQARSYSGDFDVLSGTPSGPLALRPGLAGENLVVLVTAPAVDNVLAGLGPLGYPNGGAIGEGSFAVLFDYDQSEFGFDLLGGNGGTAYISFFKRDGSLIDLVTVPNLSWNPITYAFRRVGGINDIAGISIHNDDAGGIGVDNLCHDVPGVPGIPVNLDIKPGSCPNPFNVGSQGVLPAAILGTASCDVTQIDPATILLEGVAPLRWVLSDVTTPVGPDALPCECNQMGPDGRVDLVLHFTSQDIVAALGVVADGEVRALTLTAETYAGVSVEGVDCVRILAKGKKLATEHADDASAVENGGEPVERGIATTWSTIKALYR